MGLWDGEGATEMAFNSWQGIKLSLLVHGYKKVYMLHFEGEN